MTIILTSGLRADCYHLAILDVQKEQLQLIEYFVNATADLTFSKFLFSLSHKASVCTGVHIHYMDSNEISWSLLDFIVCVIGPETEQQ